MDGFKEGNSIALTINYNPVVTDLKSQFNRAVLGTKLFVEEIIKNSDAVKTSVTHIPSDKKLHKHEYDYIEKYNCHGENNKKTKIKKHKKVKTRDNIYCIVSANEHCKYCKHRKYKK